MTEQNERWRYIKGYNGKYKISTKGRIKRKTKDGWEYLKPFDNGNGYLKANLTKDGKTTKHYLHRLVAQTFLKDEPQKQINHIDENKQNNNLNNLEFCTQKYNNWYSKAKPLIATDEKGNNTYFKSITDAQNNGFYYQRITSSIERETPYKGLKWAFITIQQYKDIKQKMEMDKILKEIKYNEICKAIEQTITEKNELQKQIELMETTEENRNKLNNLIERYTHNCIIQDALELNKEMLNIKQCI